MAARSQEANKTRKNTRKVAEKASERTEDQPNSDTDSSSIVMTTPESKAGPDSKASLDSKASFDVRIFDKNIRSRVNTVLNTMKNNSVDRLGASTAIGFKIKEGELGDQRIADILPEIPARAIINDKGYKKCQIQYKSFQGKGSFFLKIGAFKKKTNSQLGFNEAHDFLELILSAKIAVSVYETKVIRYKVR